MSRRDMIRMTPQEQQAFLESAQTATLSSIDLRGYPHSVAMWFVAEGGAIWMTTYGKSQKVRNLERNPKVAVMVESGVTYDTLKGVLLRGKVEILRDIEVTLDVLKKVHAKMMGSFPDGLDEVLRSQARKRVVLKVIPERVSSWDHSKLGGTS